MKKLFRIIIVILVLFVGFVLIKNSKPAKPPEQLSTVPLSKQTTRAYYMGFSLLLPPRKNSADLNRKMDLMAENADALIEHPDVPWKALLRGDSAEELAKNLLSSAVTKARGKNLKVLVMLEPLDGLDRAKEAVELRELKRSITEAEVQTVYRNFAKAVVKTIQPDYFGLAAEVNLFRSLGSQNVYSSLVKMVNDAAADIETTNPSLPLYASVNNEAAWGVADKQKRYQGFDYVFTDFAFMDMIGLTTYPIPLYDTPDRVPDEYFSRPLGGRSLPVIIDESGWPSRFKQKGTSPELQAQWIRKLALLADSVDTELMAQLLLLDVEPEFSNPAIELFTTQGLYTYDFQEKPALAEWQIIFQRPRK